MHRYLPHIPAEDAAGVHPVLESLAIEMYHSTPEGCLPPDLPKPLGMWAKIDPRLRDWFRDRARAFAAGDMRVAPWVIGIEAARVSQATSTEPSQTAEPTSPA